VEQILGLNLRFLPGNLRLGATRAFSDYRMKSSLCFLPQVLRGFSVSVKDSILTENYFACWN